MRFKISDGDMIIVPIKDDTPYSTSNMIRDYLTQWAKDRGLHDVRIMVANGIMDPSQGITVLSVNDIFEDVVLKK
jgi:hypothetical protein